MIKLYEQIITVVLHSVNLKLFTYKQQREDDCFMVFTYGIKTFYLMNITVSSKTKHTLRHNAKK